MGNDRSRRVTFEETADLYNETRALYPNALIEEAEALTDRYFFAPWSCLSESELEELASLASQLREGLAQA